MAQSAIIFTTNRVIRRLTTDASPSLASDETQVVLAAPITLSGGAPGWKLDVSNARVACTLAEFQAAGLDDAFNQTQRQTRFNTAITRLTNLVTSCAAVTNDATITNANEKQMATDLGLFAQGFKAFLQNQ